MSLILIFATFVDDTWKHKLNVSQILRQLHTVTMSAIVCTL